MKFMVRARGYIFIACIDSITVFCYLYLDITPSLSHDSAPEPHVLLFRRAKNFDAVAAQQQLLAQQQLNGRAAKGRKK
jgi:hypothetical protein